MAIQHKTTLLIIEDDSLVRRAMASFLQDLDYIVHQATNGKEGLETFIRTQPDLVLTDLRLPKVDGLEVLFTIREKSPDTPVIVVSGMGTLNDAIKTLKLGAQDYVTKPITDMALLNHAIKRALDRARLIRENKQYQVHLEAEVRKKTAELYQAQKLEAIGTLAGGIAHDFNNILGAILGFTELALLKTEKNSEIAYDLHQVQQAGIRAKNLVLQILTFSRKAATENRPFKVAPIIKEALALLRATLPVTVQLNQHFNAKHTIILADSNKIHQVVTNLCTNAFHALKDEQGEITVTMDKLTLTEDRLEGHRDIAAGNYLQLTVADNGCGMDQSTLDYIFDPFFTTKEKGKGTGLGLSVVHGIVTGYGGSISVKSKAGKGTSFNLLFPAVSSAAEKTTDDSVSYTGGSEAILFVDDEEGLRTLANHMLSYLGYSVVCCSSGKEALGKFAENPDAFDLVISDQSMPRMPGTELAKRLLDLSPNLPILLCTGFSSMVNKEQALAMGIKGFLMKPLSIDTLAREIRTILD